MENQSQPNALLSSNATKRVRSAGWFAAAIAGLAGFAVPAGAAELAEPVVQLAPLTVTVHPSGADERTAAVWVVSPERTTLAPVSVADLLLGVPGLHIDQPGGPGGRATIYLRGSEENHTPVFLDGIPINDPTNSRGGAVDLSIVEPGMIRSAAVVRGPASVRYGPDALAGIIHLTTTAEPADEVRLEGEGGGDAFARGGFSFSRRLDERLSFALGAAAVNDGTLAGGSRAHRRFYRAAVDVAAPLSVQLAAWRIENDADNFPDDSGGVLYAAMRDLERREDRQSAGSLRLSTKWAERTWTMSVDGAQLDSAVVSPGVAPGERDPMGLPASENDTRLQRVRASTLVEHAVGDWVFAGGLDYQHEKGRDDSTLYYGPMVLPGSYAMERDRAGLFAEASGLALERLTLTAGGRVDRYDDGLTRGTVRAGLLGNVDESTQWRVNAGNAFKPPSFYALSNPLVGNPDLRPERSRTIDAGVRRTLGGGRGLFDVSVFDTHMKDGVDLDPGPPPRVVNLSGIRSRGAEAALMLRATEALTVSGSLTYVDARTEPGDERARLRPRWRAGLATGWQATDALLLSASLTAVDRVRDTSIPTGEVMLAGWVRLDLAAVWQVRPGWSLLAAVDNATGADYEEAVGFAARGRRLRSGMRLTF